MKPVIISPAKDAFPSRCVVTKMLRRVRKDGSIRDRVELIFGIRCEMAVMRYHAELFKDPTILEYGKQQIIRVAKGQPTEDDLKFDHIISGGRMIDVKGSVQADAHIMSSKRVDDVYYVLGVPNDRRLNVTADVDVPIRLEGWCSGSELVLAPTWLKAPLYCQTLHPMEELWR